MHVIYSLALISLSDFFNLPRFISPIFKIGEWINSITHVTPTDLFNIIVFILATDHMIAIVMPRDQK